MAITEATRHQLHEALIAALGEQEAATLMEHLPPIGWADVATRNDLEHVHADIERVHADIEHLRVVLEARFDAKVAEVRTEMSDLFREAQRWQLTSLAAATAILAALITFV